MWKHSLEPWWVAVSIDGMAITSTENTSSPQFVLAACGTRVAAHLLAWVSIVSKPSIVLWSVITLPALCTPSASALSHKENKI